MFRVHGGQVFEGIAAGAVSVDQDDVWLKLFDLGRQIFGIGQNGRHLIAGKRQPGADFAGAHAGFVNDKYGKHGAYQASYRPATSSAAVAIA